MTYASGCVMVFSMVRMEAEAGIEPASTALQAAA